MFVCAHCGATEVHLEIQASCPFESLWVLSVPWNVSSSHFDLTEGTLGPSPSWLRCCHRFQTRRKKQTKKKVDGGRLIQTGSRLSTLPLPELHLCSGCLQALSEAPVSSLSPLISHAVSHPLRRIEWQRRHPSPCELRVGWIQLSGHMWEFHTFFFFQVASCDFHLNNATVKRFGSEPLHYFPLFHSPVTTPPPLGPRAPQRF